MIRPSSSTCSSTLNTSGCAFSISSKSTTRVWFTADCLSKLTALLVSYISRRRSDQSGYRIFLHVFTHINSDHILFIIKQILLPELLASSVLPTPVGPRNRKEPIGLVGSLMPALERRIASVTFCHTFILSDNSLVKLIFQSEESWLSHPLSVLLPEYRSIGK